MALIDKASLLMVPSTYEAGKLYNVLPSGNRAPDNKGGAGYDQTRADFDFDRGSNAAATRINSSGLIEKYRENVLLQSNNFGTTWATTNASVTSGQSGYDGLNNAWELKENTSTGVHEIIQTLSVSTGVQTYSLKVSANTRSKMALVLAGSAFNSGGNGVGIFNLTNGTLISSSGSLIDAKITSLGGNWYDVSITKLASSSSAVAVVQLVDDSNNTTYAGNGTGSILIQSAQLESGLCSTEYLNSTSVTAKAGVLIDLPRINYDANGENGALLLEPSRQQLIPFSEYFNASGWTKSSGVVITDNAAQSPEGLNNASYVQFGAASKLIAISTSLSTGVSCSSSCYIKGTAGETIKIAAGGVDSSNITLTGEWQRIEHTATSINSSFNINTFGGVTARNVYIFGAMMEAGSYSTSYIPNHGTSGGVTRAADSCSVTGASDVIGQTEGTLFFECTNKALLSFARYFGISDGTTTNRIDIYHHTSDRLAIYVATSGVAQVNAQNVDLPASGSFKFALAYANNDYVWYVNGLQIGTDTSASVPLCDTANIGTESLGTAAGGNSPFKQAALFNEALSDSELATLTTL